MDIVKEIVYGTISCLLISDSREQNFNISQRLTTVISDFLLASSTHHKFHVDKFGLMIDAVYLKGSVASLSDFASL